MLIDCTWNIFYNIFRIYFKDHENDLTILIIFALRIIIYQAKKSEILIPKRITGSVGSRSCHAAYWTETSPWSSASISLGGLKRCEKTRRAISRRKKGPAIFLEDAHRIPGVSRWSTIRERYLNVELPRSHRDRSRHLNVIEAGSRRYHCTTRLHARQRRRRWRRSVYGFGRARYEHRRLRRVVHIVTPEGGHGMFVLLLSFSPPARFAPQGSLSPLPGEFSALRRPRAIPVRAIYFAGTSATLLRTRSGSGPPGESGFSRRSYLHVNDGTAASWLVIGFRLRAPLREHLDAHCAGDIDISLWRSTRHVGRSSSKDRRPTLATFDVEWDLGERTKLEKLLDWSPHSPYQLKETQKMLNTCCKCVVKIVL